MNDLQATVILIRWKKHSNQMEARPGTLGEGVGRARLFSLALTVNPRGSWGSRGSAQSSLWDSRAAPRFLGCPQVSLKSAEVREEQPSSQSERKQLLVRCTQGSFGTDSRATLAPLQFGPELCVWRPLEGEVAAGSSRNVRTPADARSCAAG